MSSGASTFDPLRSLPAPIRAALEAAKKRFLALSSPMRVLLVSSTVAAVSLTGYFGYRTSEPTWAVLYSNLEREDASAALAKLKERKIPYRLEGEGNTILVPEGQARELRLELASAGLPRGGSIGFESFDKTRLGTTDFEQKILYRRALEGELARTMQTLEPIDSVRVHLVLPERSVFVAKSEPASASVVVKLRPGRALGTSEVTSIVHLIAASVGGLTPERVAVATTDGTVLHRRKRAGEDTMGMPDEPNELARSVEGALEERARSMLDRVLGPGRADVRVTAELDMSRTERTEERFDPKQVVRSEERSTEKVQDDATGGVPGTESNLPGATGKGAKVGGGGESVVRESQTRNYEVDRVAEKRTTAAGGVRRLTVAVAVDAGQPRTKQELDRVAALVKSAVGADERRGDIVTVEAISFPTSSTGEVPPPAVIPSVPVWKRPQVLAGAGAGSAIAIGAISTLLLARRRARRRAADASAAAADESLSSDETTPSDLPESTDELRAMAQDRASSDPATAALVLRHWLQATAEESPAASGIEQEAA